MSELGKKPQITSPLSAEMIDPVGWNPQIGGRGKETEEGKPNLQNLFPSAFAFTALSGLSPNFFLGGGAQLPGVIISLQSTKKEFRPRDAQMPVSKWAQGRQRCLGSQTMDRIQVHQLEGQRGFYSSFKQRVKEKLECLMVPSHWHQLSLAQGLIPFLWTGPCLTLILLNSE